MAAQAEAAPGAELYAQKLQRAQQLPERRRGAEVQAFLEWNTQLEAAAAELAPGCPLDCQLAGALRYLLATFCVAPNSAATHPLFTPPYQRLHATLAPLVRVTDAGNSMILIQQLPSLEETLAAVMVGARPLSAADLVRLLLYTCLAIYTGQYSQARSLLVFLKPIVLEAGPNERLGQQVGALMDAAAAAAGAGTGQGVQGGPSPGLPAAAGPTPAHMLRTLWHSLLLWIFVKAQEKSQLEQLGGEVAAEADLREAAAALAQLQPGSARGPYWQGRAMFQAARRASRGAGEPLRHASFAPQWLAALDRARAAGDNFWVCSIADELCLAVLMSVPHGRSPRQVAPPLPPSAVATLLDESAAALRRLRAHCPRDWWLELGLLREQMDVFQPLLEAHLQRSPGAWSEDLYFRAMLAPSVARAMAQVPTEGEVVAQLERRMVCDGCGQTAVGLRRCPKCQQAWFCGQPCFAASWERHLPACKAARAAAPPP